MLHSQYRFLLVCILFVYTGCHSTSTPADQNEPRTIKGYKGLWYTLNQPLEYGDKYGGGLGTYTAKHHPLAVYAKEVNKTFFVYGGTTTRTEKHLLAMIAYYDHNSGTVPQPVVVHDKITVDDAHDNPFAQHRCSRPHLGIRERTRQYPKWIHLPQYKTVQHRRIRTHFRR